MWDTIIACVLIDEEIDTEVKLLVQSLTANYWSQTHVIGLFKVINMCIAAVLLPLKRKPVGSCESLENVCIGRIWLHFHCTQKVNLVIELGSDDGSVH